MPFSWISWPSTRTRSSRRTPSSSAAWAVKPSPSRRIVLKTIFNSIAREGGARAAGGVALHVDRHGIHGDVRRRGLDVHRERGRVATEPLRAHAEHVDRLR